MSADYTTHEPEWETIEQGWHAVASLCNKGYHWTAYIEYVDAPYWRIWAGCMFESLQQAQEWCRKEIAHQMQNQEMPPAERDWSIEPGAWRWLWETLSRELGEERTTTIRNELAERLRKEDPARPTIPVECET